METSCYPATVERIRACFHRVVILSLSTIKRTNYKDYIWRNTHQAAPLLPLPQGLGWGVNDDCALEIRWTEAGLIPQELADIVVYSHGGDNEDDEEIPVIDNNVDLIFEA